MYKVLLHRRSKKFLHKIGINESNKIIEKIRLLQKAPLSKNLKIKRLSGTQKGFRLRISNIRVIYEIDIRKKIIYITDIDFRGNIY